MIYTALIVLLSIFLFKDKRYRWFYIIYKTFRRDIRAGISFTKLNIALWLFERNRQTVPKVFTQIASRYPNKVAFYFEDEIWTFQQVDHFSNQIAHFFKSEGYKRGDAVALLMESRPEYVCVWLGLAKIGVVTALVNNNLVSDPLIHSLRAADVKGLIYAANFVKAVKDIQGRISDIKLYQYSEAAGQTDLLKDSIELADELKNQPKIVPTDVQSGKARDKLIFIYTSGTTGLPKAAIINNLRFAYMTLAPYYMVGLTKRDILYDPLPLYHSAGGVIGVGQCLLRGICIAIRRKFSASNFWKDCVKYKCTAAQYIGEICRYILAAHSDKKGHFQHSVKKILGNGLKPQIWEKFVKTFNIPEVYEFYGATESNSNLINIDSKVGAVGFVPRYARVFYPVLLIKCDEATGAPIRDKNGFCKICSPGEAGVLIGKVNPKKTLSDFSGYADKKASQSKVLENVFTKGDRYFNTGDVLVQDEFGYYYFKDRTGDTFRWKGENVSTSEIEAVISNIVDLNDAVVYGVEVPGSEGRAGMVAVVDSSRNLDIDKLCKGLRENLPSYAVPLFVRVMESAPVTGTYKLKKVDLQKEGFCVDNIKDRLYVLDTKSKSYVELTKDKYDDIMNGKIKM